MLKHLNSTVISPKRVVVMGAGGFVGGALVTRLKRDKIPVLALGRDQVNLVDPRAADALRGLLLPDDTFVAVSARAPVKNPDMLIENMIMTGSMLKALAAASVAHVVNISSDAVYADSTGFLTESSTAAPASLHGAMHLARELMFQDQIKAPLAVLRPTLIYGPGDPHNGYGPNRFCRQVNRGEEIVLFGEGEERRDHIFIEDVADLIARVICRKSTGALNLVTGELHSFRDIAQKTFSLAGRANSVHGSPRTGPMPHNGYRPFDVRACQEAFPDFLPLSLNEGLARTLTALH
jgi:UDP-glucose 4-epimerase